MRLLAEARRTDARAKRGLILMAKTLEGLGGASAASWMDQLMVSVGDVVVCFLTRIFPSRSLI
jgi:hypothetical protein